MRLTYKELSRPTQRRVLKRYRKVHLVEGWDKPCSDKWAKHLQTKGFIVTMFHYRGFYKKGNGASFEAELNLGKFMAKENMRRMIRAGIDVMFIRKMRMIFKDIEKFGGPGAYRMSEAVNEIPQFRVFRSRNATTYNPLCMDVTWNSTQYDSYRMQKANLDKFTVDTIADYIRKRARYYATRYYCDLKRVYDAKIKEAVIVAYLDEHHYTFNERGDDWEKEDGE